MSDNFVLGRISFVSDNLVKKSEYETLSNLIVNQEENFELTLNDNQKRMYEKIVETMNKKADYYNEACYIQGFRDAIYLAGGMGLKEVI